MLAVTTHRSPFWLPRKPRKFIRDNILNGSFAFPSAVPEAVKPLIHGLLRVNESVRYGMSVYLQHQHQHKKEYETLVSYDIQVVVVHNSVYARSHQQY